MVRSRRLELPRAFAHNDLNVARLPVPPRPHIRARRRRPRGRAPTCRRPWQERALSKALWRVQCRPARPRRRAQNSLADAPPRIGTGCHKGVGPEVKKVLTSEDEPGSAPPCRGGRKPAGIACPGARHRTHRCRDPHSSGFRRAGAGGATPHHPSPRGGTPRADRTKTGRISVEEHWHAFDAHDLGAIRRGIVKPCNID